VWDNICEYTTQHWTRVEGGLGKWGGRWINDPNNLMKEKDVAFERKILVKKLGIPKLVPETL